jgi:hypothetical protein
MVGPTGNTGVVLQIVRKPSSLALMGLAASGLPLRRLRRLMA